MFKGNSAYKLLSNDIARKTISNAYMVISTDTIAAEHIVDIFVCGLYCKRGGCMACAECAKVLDKNHTSVIRYDLTSEVVRVEDIKQLVYESNICSVDGDRKVYIFSSAQKLSIACQNTLLKTVEEPVGGNIVIFVTANEQAMLSTIRSRSKKIFVERFSNDELITHLVRQGVERGQAEKAVLLAEGNLTRATAFTSKPEILQCYEQAIGVLEEAKDSKSVAVALANVNQSKEFLQELINMIELLVRDMILFKRLNRQVLARVEKLAERYTTAALANFETLICEAREKLQANCNAQQVMDSLIFGILEVAYKCR